MSYILRCFTIFLPLCTPKNENS